MEIPNKVKEYLDKHSLDPEFLINNLGWNWNDKTIIIPIYNQSGKQLYCKYRHLDFEEKKAAGDPSAKKFSFDPGSHPTLYGIHLIKKNTQVVLSEGELDAARLWQSEIPAVTSTGGVTKFDPVMAQMLSGLEIFICLDTDKAGQDRVMDIARTLLNAGVTARIIDLPDKIKDVCEFFAGNFGGKEKYLELIKKALTAGEWWQIHKPESFATISGDILLETDFPPNQWLVNRILPKEGLVFVFAAEASYKTYITLDIALSLTAGINWLGQDEFKVEAPAKVLFIDKENPLEMIKRRIKGLGFTSEVAKNVRWVKYPEKLQMCDPNGEISDFMKSLGEEVEGNNIALIIVDSFVDLMVGSENSAEDTQAFITAVREAFPSRCILTLHHENKPSQGTFRSDAQRNRGSTNLNAQCSTMFRLELVAKSKTEFTIKQTKARDAQKLDKFLVEARIETDEDGKTYVAGFDYKGVVKDDAEDKVGEAQQIIEEMFKDNPILSKTIIIDTCKSQNVLQRSVERALKNMIDSGIIDAIPDTLNGRKKNYILISVEKRGDSE